MLDRMILCSECGNKRCPKASDHTLQCTGSNELHQAGSVFSTPPAQPAQRTEDSVRLDFVLEKAAYVTSSILNRKQVFQLQADDGVVLSGRDQFFSTAREAIDAAIEAAHGITKGGEA